MLTLAALLLVSILLCWWVPAAVLFLLLAFVTNFFRDPEREVPSESGLFIAPADGKVIRAEETAEGLRIGTFMNVFNVHVNRAPVSGRITHMHYYPGKFINASFDKASEENERNRFEMETDDGARIAFTQIAGLVARRIVSYVAVGDMVKRGERIGMILFGSRVDCEIPKGYKLCVGGGEHVTAGKTVLARWEGNDA